MMETLRRGATSKVAALVLFLPLIGAFALWGIGPGFLSGDRQWLAKVGNTTIYPEEFDRAFRTELEQVSQQAGRQITPDMARSAGLDRRVLARLVGRAALDQEVSKLGLAVSNQAIIDEIRKDPNFADPSGAFSKPRFDEIMRQVGMSEAGYIATRKRDEVREQLTDSVLTGVEPAQAYIDFLNKYRNETRVIEHVTIDPAKAIKLAEPDEAKLKEFYDGNKGRFVTEEQRKIGVLLLTRAASKTKIEVSDADVKNAYDANKDHYNIPETRHIYQMSFPDTAAAEAAQPALAKAKDFVDAGVKLGAKATDIDLGLLSRAQMIDSKIADAAFALKKDEVSKVIAGTFTTVVMKVTEIKPAEIKTLTDVAAQVKDTLQTQRANAEMQSVANQVEDERSAGKPLSEIGKQLGLEYKEIASIDRAGKGPDSKPALDSPDLTAIAAAAFSGSVGLDPDPVDLSDTGAAWVSVLAVMPTTQRPYDDVKAEVKTAWTDDAMRRETGTLAANLVERLLKGESFEAVAKDAGAKAEKTSAIARNASPPGLPANAVKIAFTLPSGGASSALTVDSKSRVVFKVDAVNVAEPPSKAQADRLKAELTQEMQSDTLNTLVDGLQKEQGLSLNEAAFSQLLNAGQPR